MSGSGAAAAPGTAARSEGVGAPAGAATERDDAHRPRRLPARDPVLLAFLAVNFAFLGLETLLVHVADGALVSREWIPVLFSPVAAVLLGFAGLMWLRDRLWAATLATVPLLASLVVGGLGCALHLIRGARPFAPPGQRLDLDLLVWAPPVLGPAMFVVVGVLGLTAAWPEDPPGSGRLRLPGGVALRLPYPKSNAYFYVVALAVLLTLISSVLDHARFGLADPWVGVPVLAGVFATTTTALLGAIARPTRGDLFVHAFAMGLLMVTGALGAWLHVRADLVAGGGALVAERLLRGAPPLAPLLFTNVGMLGLLVLLPAGDGGPCRRGDRRPR